MGRTAWERSEGARKLLQQADRILGEPYRFLRVLFEGPAETLNRTDYSQPALYATGLALAAMEDERHPGWRGSVKAAAGLSLGEFTALAFAGAFSFEAGLRLVALRGKLMQEACEAHPGGMLSCLGLSRQAVEECIKSLPGSGALVAANINAPNQIVLSGTRERLEQAAPLLKEKGAGRVIPLKVAGAFHSPLMITAQQGLHEALATLVLEPPRVPIYLNAVGESSQDPETIRQALANQLTSPVEWWPSMERAWTDGLRTFIEFGPGGTLTALLRKNLSKERLEQTRLTTVCEGTEELP